MDIACSVLLHDTVLYNTWLCFLRSCSIILLYDKRNSKSNKCLPGLRFMDDYSRGSHSVYKLTYHIIFVTKYRKYVPPIPNMWKNICGRIRFGAQVIAVQPQGQYPWEQSSRTLKGRELTSTNVSMLNPASTERRFIPQPTHVGRGFLANLV